MTNETLSPDEIDDRIADLIEKLYDENQLAMCEAHDPENMARLNSELAALKKRRGDPVECFSVN